MSPVFHFPNAAPRDPEVEAWFLRPDHEMRRLAQPWFEALRGCGEDVRELLHDGWPTACAGDAAFACVAAGAHAAIGFFFGAELSDPAGLLEGSGKRMRHVKLRWGQPADEAAIRRLIGEAYRDIRSRVSSEPPG